MALPDAFDSLIAYNPETEELVGDAPFQVFAVDDLARLTPLTVTDPVSGAAIPTLQSSKIGVLPDFRVAGDPPQVILKSGAFLTKLTSKFGVFREAGFDPEMVAAAATAGTEARAAAVDALAAQVAATTARDQAEAAKQAAEAVPTTTDGLLTSILQDPGSAFSDRLGKSFAPTPGDIFAKAPAGDASAYLNALASQAAVQRSNVLLMPGVYVVNSTLALDVAKHGFFAPYGGVTIDQRGLPVNGVGMRITASAAIPATAPNPYGIQWGGFQLHGPGMSTASIGILFDTAAGSVSVDLRSVQVRQFGIGHEYKDNAYIVNHFGGNVSACAVGAHTHTATVNGGERLTYVGHTISGCDLAFHNEGANSRFHVVASSVDYNKQVYKSLVANFATFIGCHLEMSMTESTVPFQVAGNASLIVSEGLLVQTGTYDAATAKAAMVQNDNDATLGALVSFDGLWMNNLRTTSDMFAAGVGQTEVSRRALSGGVSPTFTVVGESANLLCRGNFETATIEDNWVITGDTAAITDAFTGANVAIIHSNSVARTGTRSLRISKVGGVGTVARVTVLVPIRHSALVGFLGFFQKGAGVTGGATGILYYCAPRRPADLPLNIGRTAQASTSAASMDLTAGFAAWTSWSSGRGSTRRAPSWATHVALVIDVTAMSAGNLFLDDLVITQS